MHRFSAGVLQLCSDGLGGSGPKVSEFVGRMEDRDCVGWRGGSAHTTNWLRIHQVSQWLEWVFAWVESVLDGKNKTQPEQSSKAELDCAWMLRQVWGRLLGFCFGRTKMFSCWFFASYVRCFLVFLVFPWGISGFIWCFCACQALQLIKHQKGFQQSCRETYWMIAAHSVPFCYEVITRIYTCNQRKDCSAVQSPGLQGPVLTTVVPLLSLKKSSRRRMGSWELWILAAICVSGLRIDAVGRKRLEGQRACVCLGLKWRL